MDKQKKTKKKLIGNIVYSVFIVAVITFTLFMLLGRSNNRINFIFDRAVVWILSPSMEDTIPAKSYILIKKSDVSEIEINDIIIFYSDDPNILGALNTHRVVDVKGEHAEFVTKGDNNTATDKYTAKAEKVVGKYQKNLTLLTALMGFFMTKLGLVLLVLLFIGFMALIYIPDIISKNKNKQE